MEKEKQKYLYETTVKKEVIEKITEEREENGQKIQVTKEVKSFKPLKIAVLKPDRKKYKEADIFYAKTLSNYLKEGLLPYSLVSKRYMNDGGPLTDDEKKAVTNLQNQYYTLQEEYFKISKTPESEKRSGEIIFEMTEINKKIESIRDNYSEIYNNTAEAKSRNDTIEWWILNLSFIEDADGKGYKSLYGDGDFESRYSNLESLESQNENHFNEAIKKLSYFISFWYNSGGNIEEKDWKSAEDYYVRNNPDFTEEKKEEPKKEEPKNEDVKKVEQVQTEIKQPENQTV